MVSNEEETGQLASRAEDAGKPTVPSGRRFAFAPPPDPPDLDSLLDDKEQRPPRFDPDGKPIERRRSRSWKDAPRVYVLYYTAAFVIAEAVGALAGIEYQLALDALLLVVAFNHALFGFRNSRTAAVVMTAIFTTRLATLALPVTGVSIATRTGIIAAFVILIARLAVWVLYHDVNETRSNEGFGLKKPIVSVNFTTILVILSAVPLGVGAYLALKPEPLITQSLAGSLLLAWSIVVLLFIIGALSEELVYRQLVAAMVQHTGSSQTALISGVLFAAAYFGTLNPAFIAIAFVTGCWFAWSCERTGSLQGPVVAHSLISILVFVILPTSGIG